MLLCRLLADAFQHGYEHRAEEESGRQPVF